MVAVGDLFVSLPSVAKKRDQWRSERQARWLVLDHRRDLLNDAFFDWSRLWRSSIVGGCGVVPRLIDYEYEVSEQSVSLYSVNWERHCCLLLFAVGGLQRQNWQAVARSLCESYARDSSMGPCVGCVFFGKPPRYAP
jgi:hypothetical protein